MFGQGTANKLQCHEKYNSEFPHIISRSVILNFIVIARSACRVVEELIKSEVKQGTPENKIILAGVGQGGAVALGMLRYLKQVSGIIGANTL